ncbi:MAG: hypothetical protein ACYTGQ_04965 [Planctomycetota bacterium]|jgi:hypothetical protein
MSDSKKKRFPNAHLWLLAPFAIAIAGFYIPYWSKFTEVPFRQHAHGLSAAAWLALLVLQPWLYHNKPVSFHRKAGFAGVFLAGGVVFSALAILPHNFDKTSPLMYGITFHNACVLSGFSLAVIMAMLNSRNISLHARWMITTAIWILQPAVTRLIYLPLVRLNDGQSPIEYVVIWYSCMLVSVIPLLVMIGLDYKNERKAYTPYVFTLVGVAIAIGLMKPMSEAQWWVGLCDTVLLKGVD